ncbi:polycystin-1-like protein 2 [Physella acuta]|uniref:polycystin-1-like protein 2 n=1 Tax=Physella acuta TaxID=109671 RepID=UPI0027DD0EA0|nr:polycystin-1-like protein 2 [Physella acuta]
MDRLNTMLNYLMDDKMMAFVSQEDKEKAMRSIFSALGSVMEAAGSNGFYPTLTELKATQKEKSWFKYDTSLTATEDPLNLDVESARSDDEALKYHTRNVHKAVYADTVKAINQQTDAMLQKLAKLFSSFAIPGQWQNSTTSRLKYTMQKNFASKFAGASVQPPNSDATILFPNTTADLFPSNFQAMKNQVVTFQLSQTTNYPDRYTPVALEGIYSYTHFLNIELYDSSGQPLKIENTTKPIKITIPHDSQGPRGGIKPIRGIVTGWNLFQLHQTETKSHGSSIHLRFQLAAGTQLLVVVRYGEVPDPANNLTDFIFVVPPTVPPSPKLKDPYTILIDNVAVAGRKGKWYIGTRERNATYRNTPAPTNQEIVERYKKGAGEFINDYNLTIWTSGCFFHTVNASDWSNKGCVVSSESSQEKTVCLCNHLTTFAGGFIVVPNVIDWNYVFAHADFLSNPTLYLTEIFIAVIFSIAFFLARRKDKRDMSLLGLAPLADNDPRDKYYYEIIVSTGMRRNAGTDSKVFFILSGEDEESDVRVFTDTKRPIFKKGMTNGFLMATPECLGRINYMRVWHDNSGKGKFGSWFLNYITVRDLQTDVKQVFIANRWFALEEDDGQIDRIIPLAGKEQLQDFSYQFSERSKKNLADGHLWFSVVARPPGSRFTCVQRVACCLCLLFMTMLTNAMFYNTSGSTSTSASTSFEFGPFSLSVSQIFIGFISTVIVFPVNFLLVFLFRKAQPRHKRPSRVQLALAGDTRPGTAKLSQVNPQMDSEFTRSTTSLATTVSMPDARSDKEKLVKDGAGPSSPIPSESPSSSTVSAKKKSLQLPWWCQIVAWVILVLCTIMSVALVTFYGISFQDSTCKKWITSLIISFFTSVFITQPIKVILTAIFLSLIIRNPGEDEDDEESDEETYPINTEDGFMHTDIDGSFAAARPKKVGYKPPNPKEIERMREIRLKEVKMWGVIREILFYSMFLWILLIITHRSRGPDNWRYKNTMDRTFIECMDYKPKFTDIGNIDDFWKWIETSFLSGIMASSYYNDYPPLRLRSYVNDKSSRILGHATMRQLRVKADQCEVPKPFRNMIHECNVPYTIFDQEDRDFDVGWTELGPNKTGVKNSGYTWSTAESLNSYPYLGSSTLYSGGGYVVHLTGSRTQLNDTFKRLQTENWIDRYTRVVFIEFTVYNPQINLFSVNTMLIELDIANGLQPSYRFEPAMLLPYMDNAMIFQIVCEAVFVIYIIVFIVIEIRQFIKLKGQYFFQFWTWMELSTIGCSIGAIVIYFYRMFETNKLLKQVKSRV